MHELSLTQRIVETVEEQAKGARVLSLVLEIGRLSAILPDSVKFCFDICARGTPLEGARLEVLEPPGLGRCRKCRTELPLEQLFGQCSCGSYDLEILSGEQLRIREVVIVDEEKEKE